MLFGGFVLWFLHNIPFLRIINLSHGRLAQYYLLQLNLTLKLSSLIIFNFFLSRKAQGHEEKKV